MARKTVATQQAIIDQLTEHLDKLSRRIKALETQQHIDRRSRRAEMEAAKQEAMRTGRFVRVTH